MGFDSVRVVHVIPTVARSSGGPAEVIRDLLPRLLRDGISPILVTTDKGNSSEDADITHWPYARIVHGTLVPRWTFSPGIVPRLWSEIGNCDIVHVHSIHTFPTTMALLIARLRGRPAVLQPHGALNRYHLRQGKLHKLLYLRLVDKFGLGSVRAVIYSSDVEASDGAAVLAGLPSWKLPLGVDESVLTGVRRQSAPPQILFLSRLARKKRVDLFLRALATSPLVQVDFRAVVAGPIDGDLPYDPQELAAELGVDHRVTFVGKVGKRERAALLGESDIFVLPSDDESFGMAVAEAMGAGCAVVCTPNVGIAWDARAEEAVELVSQSPESISKAIASLIADAPRRTELGTRARLFVMQNLDWDVISSGLISRYENLLLNRPVRKRHQGSRKQDQE